MAGYDFDNGMSNNAVDAYHRGVKPLTKITVDDLRAVAVGDMGRELVVGVHRGNRGVPSMRRVGGPKARPSDEGALHFWMVESPPGARRRIHMQNPELTPPIAKIHSARC